MQTLSKIFIVITYPLLLVAWLVNRVLGRDRLRLDDVQGGASCWTERRAQPALQSYFSEESCSEGDREPSAARPLIRWLFGNAQLYRPSRRAAGTMYNASAERQKG